MVWQIKPPATIQQLLAVMRYTMDHIHGSLFLRLLLLPLLLEKKGGWLKLW